MRILKSIIPCCLFITCFVLIHSGQARVIEPIDGVLFMGFGQESTGQGSPTLTKGPRPGSHPNFHSKNLAKHLDQSTPLTVIADPGDGSQFDFNNGDEITMEAWVNIKNLRAGTYAYVLGKGRSGSDHYQANNQNYALRLTNVKGKAAISFLFRDSRSLEKVGRDSEQLWHRWTSSSGFALSSGWHHVAITYQFGTPDSIQGFIDGKPQKGNWDMGGKTTHAPVIDNDSIFIGGGNGDNPSNRFIGRMDSIAIHRVALSPEQVATRYQWKPATIVHAIEDLPTSGVLLEVFEGLPVSKSWVFDPPSSPDEIHEIPFFALDRLPQKYSEEGLRKDRKGPVLLRFSGAVEMDKGKHQFLLRSLNGARVFINGEIIGSNPFISGNADGHGEVGQIPSGYPKNLRYPLMGHKDRFFTFNAKKAGTYQITMEAILGGSRLPVESGEIAFAKIENETDEHHIVSSSEQIWSISDPGWESASRKLNQQFTEYNDRIRREKFSSHQASIIKERHKRILEKATTHYGEKDFLPEVRDWENVSTPIDRFIQAQLEKSGIKPSPRVDDLAFLRRLSLDTIGVPPTREEVSQYLNWPDSERRQRAIRHFVNREGWADNWVSYWQDVLAENPAILKPTLNNTGPFRYWIRESFLDNKPFDQFIREIVLMDGSIFGGGPAGFGIATQNDVPMADKAQILSQAFLAKNLSCARCHDAPFHDFTQKDLFGFASLLDQKSIKLPASSSVPIPEGEEFDSQIEVSLKPGDVVAPHWSLGKDNKTLDSHGGNSSYSGGNQREALSKILTEDNSFTIARVFVNRLWKKYIGKGFVEPVDDWQDATVNHPDLLDWLALEFIRNEFDIKYLAQLIFQSDVYQRGFSNETNQQSTADSSFERGVRRRMSAEQIVDSTLHVSGRKMKSERLTLDNDGKRLPNVFLNLGYPAKAWEFTGLSNDRDRPALSMPRTQEIVDFMKIFGWRETRQNPISERDQSPNSLQPASMANSQFINARAITVTDDSDWTQMALESNSVEELIDKIYIQVLTRYPIEEEKGVIASILAEGFEDRVVTRELPEPKTAFDPNSLLSWTNHLNSKATDIKLEVEKRAQQGDPPTEALQSQWRENYEDVIWSLINSTEFIYLP